MEISKQDKLKLIHLLNFICDYEASKPIEEMDEELINSCVRVLLELQNKHVKHSPEFIKDEVRKIFGNEETEATVPEAVTPVRKRYGSKRLWLVAACISILVALFSIISFGSEKSVADTLEDFFGTFEFIPFGKQINVDNETYGKGNSSRHYDSIQEFVENESFDLLFPKSFSESITKISVSSDDGKETISFADEKTDLYIDVSLNSDISQEVIDTCNKTISLNGTACYLSILPDVQQAQAYFVHNNNFYTVIAETENDLINIINDMEEIEYEN